MANTLDEGGKVNIGEGELEKRLLRAEQLAHQRQSKVA
jgi:hypothetical protein